MEMENMLPRIWDALRLDVSPWMSSRVVRSPQIQWGFDTALPSAFRVLRVWTQACLKFTFELEWTGG